MIGRGVVWSMMITKILLNSIAVDIEGDDGGMQLIDGPFS